MKKYAFIPLMLFMFIILATAGYTEDRVALEGVLNINTATAEQLMLLPGIGEKKAQLIIEQRTQNKFKNMEDVLAVKGVGEKLIERWKAYLIFEGTTTIKTVAQK